MSEKEIKKVLTSSRSYRILIWNISKLLHPCFCFPTFKMLHFTLIHSVYTPKTSKYVSLRAIFSSLGSKDCMTSYKGVCAGGYKVSGFDSQINKGTNIILLVFNFSYFQRPFPSHSVFLTVSILGSKTKNIVELLFI